MKTLFLSTAILILLSSFTISPKRYSKAFLYTTVNDTVKKSKLSLATKDTISKDTIKITTINTVVSDTTNNVVKDTVVTEVKTSKWRPFKSNTKASYYHKMFNGRKTANGEIFSNSKISAAHKTLPFGTMLKVTNRLNGKSIVVRINDRGPYVKGREIDLSKAAFDSIGKISRGILNVDIEIEN